MPNPECLKLCPYVTVCREDLIVDLETPSSTDLHEADVKLDKLISIAAQIAVTACTGPQIEERTVEKGGYFRSKKPVTSDVYVCGRDGFAQKATFYYQKDRMP